MLDRKTAFVDLLKQENLKKLDIDKKLLPYFANVVRKMQVHFDKKGYINANNYSMLFEKYLLTPGKDRFKIGIKLLGKNTLGTYDYAKKEININKNLAKNTNLSSQIEATICHELLHFIVMTTLPYIEQKDGTFVQNPHRHKDIDTIANTFINEGYVELLTREIYPDSSSYTAQVEMVKFANFVNNSKGNNFAFLRQQFPGLYYRNHDFVDFKLAAKKFHETAKSHGIADAAYDSNYLDAQRYLTMHFSNLVTREIEDYAFANVLGYVKRVSQFKHYLPVKNAGQERTIEYLNRKFIETYYQDEKYTPTQKNIYLKNLESLIEMDYRKSFGISEVKEFKIKGAPCKLEIMRGLIGLNVDGVEYLFRRGISNCNINTGKNINDIKLKVILRGNAIKILDHDTLDQLEYFDIDPVKHEYKFNKVKETHKKNRVVFAASRDINNKHISHIYKRIKNIYKLDKMITTSNNVKEGTDIYKAVNIADSLYYIVINGRSVRYIDAKKALNDPNLKTCRKEFESEVQSGKSIFSFIKGVKGAEVNIDDDSYFVYKKGENVNLAVVNENGNLENFDLKVNLVENDFSKVVNKSFGVIEQNTQNDRIF